MLFDVVAARPDRPALDDGERARTFAELHDRAVRAGHLLLDRTAPSGSRPGTGGHAALVMGNRVEFVELVLGSLLAGTWVTPVNHHLTADEAAFVVADAGARLLVTDPDHEALARAVAEAAGGIEVLVAGPEFDDALASSDDRPFDPAGAPGGSMFYTSGTTGRPKGVRRATATTLGDQLSALASLGPALGLRGDGPHLVTGPLYHAAPLGFALMDLVQGAELVLHPRFDPAATLDAIEQREVRTTHLVPTMFVRLLALPAERRERFDPGSLRSVLHGAAPIAPHVKEQMIAWWGPVLVEYWGGSEGGVVTAATTAEWVSHPGTVGRPIAGHDVWAADADGRRLGAGEVGLLWCRHPRHEQVFAYHGRADATAAAHPEPGTYTLGDVGWVDDDGFVHLSDRASNTIISGGVNIYPAEVEAALSSHPAIADVAVFGVPDDEWGEQVKAAVELAPGERWTPELEADVLAHARRSLAGFKVPRSFDVHESLPRQPTGKLATRALRVPYWEGRERSI